MAPSKAWMDLVDDRISDECLDGNTSKNDIYLAGVKKFLDYAFSRTGGDVEIKCPCVRCCNTYCRSREVVYSHLKIFGIIGNYRFWYHHGEVSGEAETDSDVEEHPDSHGATEEGYNGMEDMLMDLFPQFFGTLNSKALSVDQLKQLESLIARTLCKLEMEFPPFFDPMVHLPVHLATEALIGGPTVYRWMYQFERQIKFLKSLIRNLAHPEGSIAEGYIAYEFINLSSRYLDDVEIIHNRNARINDTSDHENFDLSIFSSTGQPLGAHKTRDLDMLELQQAHIYVLRNYDEVLPFISEYSNSQEGSEVQPFTPSWNQNFIMWFKDKVHQLHENDKSQQMEDLLSLSRGPMTNITCFSSFDMNGYRFRIESLDRNRCTQNSGVAVISEGNMNGDHVDYYGVLTEILELQFLGGRRVPLFRCKWVLTMQRGKYGNLTAAALKRSQFISPGLLRQQQVRRIYPNISSDTTFHNSINEDTNNVHTSVRKTTQVPEAEHGGASDTLFDRTVNAKKFKYASQPCSSDASENLDDEEATDECHEWNRATKKSKSTSNRDDCWAIDQDRMLAGRSRNDDTFIEQYSARVARSGIDHRAIHQENTQAERRRIPHSSTYSMQDGGKTVQKRQGCGRNKCKKVAKLKTGEKIKVTFYNNRALSKTFPRQLGRIVRDSNITPIRVKKWTDISPAARNHIFDAIKDKFENANPDIEIDVYKDEIMEHARDLWNNWRGDLNRHFIKPARNMQQAIKNCPKDIKKPDWEWLVKEHFYSKDFIDKSKRNSKNRSNLKILHHSGSKPYRQIIWDNGGKQNNPPTLDKLFSLTHMKDRTFVDSETSTKHAEIQVERLLNPSLSNVELMDKCFESNRHDHVVGYGGGIKARDLRSPIVTKAELIEKLTQSEQEKKELQEDNRALHEENRMITNRVSRMEEEWAELKRNMTASLPHE